MKNKIIIRYEKKSKKLLWVGMWRSSMMKCPFDVFLLDVKIVK